jgi:hypothetical protein
LVDLLGDYLRAILIWVYTIAEISGIFGKKRVFRLLL